MIKLNELRDGNFVLDTNNEIRKIAIKDSVVNIETEKGFEKVNLEQISGVLLDKDVLLNFNFIPPLTPKDDYLIVILDYAFHLKYLDWRKDWTFGVSYSDLINEADTGKVFPFSSVKYLHQLQNLFFGLTKLELEGFTSDAYLSSIVNNDK